MSSSNITIMSYNTWSEDIFCEERLTNLITLIYYNNCDILCFQELTPYIFNKLIHRISLKYPYIISTPELENCKNYGTAIFSKYKIDEYFSNELFTNKQKYILLAKIKMKDIIYNICTSNLEIDEETNQSKDFNQILGSLSQFNNCVFLGGIDNNLISIEDDELNIINSELWTDSWIKDGSLSNKEYTMNYKTNIFVKDIQSRNDRIFFKTKDFEFINFNIVGSNHNPTPSNHYGLIINLKSKNVSNSSVIATI
jgi:hypothetical protein